MARLLRLCLGLISLALCLVASNATFAQAAKPEAIESAKNALRSSGAPWYDAETDGIKRLVVKPSEEAERKDWKPQGAKWTWNWDWWPTFPYLGEVFKYLVWALFIGLIGLLVYALVRAFLNMDPKVDVSSRKLSAEEEAANEARRIENLPTNVTARKGNFLDAARRYYDEGNFAQAIIYLFSHRLLQLDRAGYIRLTKGKTNRQYLTEIRESADLQKILGQTIVPFEDVFFGKHSLTRERFENCWQRNDQFENLLQQVGT